MKVLAHASAKWDGRMGLRGLAGPYIMSSMPRPRPRSADAHPVPLNEMFTMRLLQSRPALIAMQSYPVLKVLPAMYTFQLESCNSQRGSWVQRPQTIRGQADRRTAGSQPSVLLIGAGVFAVAGGRAQQGRARVDAHRSHQFRTFPQSQI